jgi:hypothetical protein
VTGQSILNPSDRGFNKQGVKHEPNKKRQAVDAGCPGRILADAVPAISLVA